MKKGFYIIGLLVLAAVAVYVITQDTSSTIKGEKSDFAVEDTASITKIFLADKNDETILLERKGDHWIVNREYRARQEAVQVLLETIKKIRVRAPVPRSAFENVVKTIAGKSVKVEIYQGGDSPSKVYYVGHANQDHTGTYMLLENSSVPFLMHIEGMRGYLTPRYFTNLNEWRHNGIFTSSPTQIAELKVEYPKEEEKSFKIFKNSTDEAFRVEKIQSNEGVMPLDTAKLMRYLLRYKMVYFEGFEETKEQTFIDSIIASTPEQVYTLTQHDGTTNTVEVYLKPAHEGASDYEGNPIEYDLDRLYGYVNGEDFVVIQYVIFDPLKKQAEDFLEGAES